LEIEFLTNYLKKTDTIIDIGSGSGLIVNKLIGHVKSIVAVEKFEGFTKFITDHPDILVVNADLIGFKIRKQFNAALCFGVSQCFEENSMTDIYANVYSMLKEGGLFVVRMQCGIEKGKTIDGYSDELQTDYFADYRHWEREIEILEKTGFKNIKKFDIFPDSLNVWTDTRHYIFVCEK
jgi:cyclopropane fatty-acyl-phospholipid synthase-like methyltransferase